jgi:anti-sigma B factor antagonist
VNVHHPKEEETTLTVTASSCGPAGCVCPVVEIAVEGDLDIHVIPRMRERLQDALRLSPHTLTTDLTRCGFFDAAGINMLLGIHRQACAQGTSFRLRGCSDRHLRILALMGLNGVLDVCDG